MRAQQHRGLLAALALHLLEDLGVRIEELAYQRWEGERIVREQFFYDPKQFAAAPG